MVEIAFVIVLMVILMVMAILWLIAQILIGINFIDNYSWIEYIGYYKMNLLGKIVCLILNIIIFPISYLIYGIYKLFYWLFHL